MSPTGRLIGRSGELAGKKFELSGDTTIARGGTINISSDARARIYTQGEDFYIEGSGVVVDGSPLSGPTQLGRMHVLEVGGLEMVFTKTAQPAAAAAPPPAPPPPPPPPPPPVVETERTVVDMQGFGALPELSRTPAPPPPPAPAPPPPAPVPEERERTVVDMMGFGELPSLQAPAPTPAPTPAPAPAPVVDNDRTVAIPAPSKPQRQYVLVVNIPNEGARTFPLKRGDNVLGRGDASDIKLPDPEQWLSRKHAMVRVNDDDSIELVDLNGVNGTFVKGVRIESARLQPGATFVLGPNLEFKLQEK